MKIFVINPNTSDEMTAGIDASAKAYARPNTEITTGVQCSFRPG